MQLSRKLGISMPISEAVLKILEGKIEPKEAVSFLMQRDIKEETL